MDAELSRDLRRATQIGDDAFGRCHVDQCSDIHYAVKPNVAKCATDNLLAGRYTLRMLAIWVQEALKHANMSGAELARRLSERLGRSIDRAAVSKMQLTEATPRTKPRAVSADEMMAISEITGYPPPILPEEVVSRVPLISWVSAGSLNGTDGVDSFSGLPTVPVAGLPPGRWIALEVTGDSMDRISPPGSIILVNRADRRLVPNACYVIGNPEGEATYKRYRPNPMRFEPVSVNPEHAPIFPDHEPKIIGRVRMTMLTV